MYKPWVFLIYIKEMLISFDSYQWITVCTHCYQIGHHLKEEHKIVNAECNDASDKLCRKTDRAF